MRENGQKCQFPKTLWSKQNSIHETTATKLLDYKGICSNFHHKQIMEKDPLYAL